MRALAFAFLAACAEAPMEIDEMSCAQPSTLTYDNFGANFLSTYCNSCHASGTAGAPRDIKFNSIDDVHSHRSRIFIRAAGPNVTMPPGPTDPPQAERDQLAEWLACGTD